MGAPRGRGRAAAGLPPITLRELNRATLARQWLSERLPRTVSLADAVERVGGLQAQHPDWPRVALWTRAEGLELDDLRHARDRREVVRASLMRRTLHVVSARDYWPIWTLVQAFVEDAWRLTFREDPRDTSVIARLRPAQDAALEALAQRPRTAAELAEVMTPAAQTVAERASRYLVIYLHTRVPLVVVPHERESYSRSYYAVAADWLGEPPEWSTEPDAALRHLAERYLGAFGPASVDDFTSYLGRRGSLVARRRAVESLGDRLIRFRDEDGRELVDLVDAPRPPGDAPVPPRMLARWDSALLSHEPRHRTRILPEAYRSTVITNNGDVLPTFLSDGFVRGTWHLTETRGEAIVALRPFGTVPARDRAALEDEAERLAAFVAPEATRRGVRWDAR